MYRFGGFLVAAALLFSAVPLHAQSYPRKPIKLITGSPAGAISDIGIRMVLPALSQRLGQQVVLDNRTGASGIIAQGACAQATPDGYTACMVSSDNMSFNPNVYSSLPYDVEKDFSPVGRLFFMVGGLFANAKFPANSVPELKALAIARPGSINFGTLGQGTIPDVFRQYLAQQWNTEMVGVGYKGGNLVAAALINDEVQIGSIGLGTVMAQVQAGRAKVLALNLPERFKDLPNVPTYSESGIGDGEARVFWGVNFPARTPDAIVEQWAGALAATLRDPGVVAELESKYLLPSPTASSAEWATFLKTDRAHVGELVRRFHVPRQ